MNFSSFLQAIEEHDLKKIKTYLAQNKNMSLADLTQGFKKALTTNASIIKAFIQYQPYITTYSFYPNAILEACENEKLDIAQLLISHIPKPISINDAANAAVKADFLPFFQYIIGFHPEYDISQANHFALKQSVLCKEKKIFKYLLECPLLENKIDLSIDESYLGTQLIKANDLATLHYVLTSPKLIKNIDIHADNDKLLEKALEFGNMEIVKYLLTSEELKEKANPYAHNSMPLMVTFFYAEACMPMIEYLIMDYKLEYTQDIKDMCHYKPAIEMFKIRDMKEQLEIKVSTKKSLNPSRRLKI